MNIKIWAIMAGASVLLTILLLILFPGNSSSSAPVSKGNGAGSSVVLSKPNVDLNTPPSEGKAKIGGKICFDEGLNLDNGITVVAEKIPSKDRLMSYYPGPISEVTNYALELDPGTYTLYTELGQRKKLGLYSKYVLCTSQPGRSCIDHSLINVTVSEGQILKDVDICDYDWDN